MRAVTAMTQGASNRHPQRRTSERCATEMAAKCPECGQADQRRQCDRRNAPRWKRDEEGGYLGPSRKMRS